MKAKELFQNKLNDYNFTQREKTGDKIFSVNLLLTNNCGVHAIIIKKVKQE